MEVEDQVKVEDHLVKLFLVAANFTPFGGFCFGPESGPCFLEQRVDTNSSEAISGPNTVVT